MVTNQPVLPRTPIKVKKWVREQNKLMENGQYNFAIIAEILRAKKLQLKITAQDVCKYFKVDVYNHF